MKARRNTHGVGTDAAAGGAGTHSGLEIQVAAGKEIVILWAYAGAAGWLDVLEATALVTDPTAVTPSAPFGYGTLESTCISGAGAAPPANGVRLTNIALLLPWNGELVVPAGKFAVMRHGTANTAFTASLIVEERDLTPPSFGS